MTEKELLDLGFVKEFSLDTIDDQPEYYYYTRGGGGAAPLA